MALIQGSIYWSNISSISLKFDNDYHFLQMTTTLRDMMRKRLETIASVQDAARKMKDKDISSLIVIDRDGKPQGLITERDLVTKICINDTYTRQNMAPPLSVYVTIAAMVGATATFTIFWMIPYYTTTKAEHQLNMR